MLIGAARSSASEVDLPLESVSVNSGALLPARGAPSDAGSHLAKMRVAKMKSPIISTPSPASKELPSFAISERSGANARLTPTNKSANAIMHKIRFAHGKSRVIGKLTKNNE